MRSSLLRYVCNRSFCISSRITIVSLPDKGRGDRTSSKFALCFEGNSILDNERAWHADTVGDTAKALKSEISRGLTDQEAKERLGR